MTPSLNHLHQILSSATLQIPVSVTNDVLLQKLSPVQQKVAVIAFAGFALFTLGVMFCYRIWCERKLNANSLRTSTKEPLSPGMKMDFWRLMTDFEFQKFFFLQVIEAGKRDLGISSPALPDQKNQNQSEVTKNAADPAADLATPAADPVMQPTKDPVVPPSAVTEDLPQQAIEKPLQTPAEENVAIPPQQPPSAVHVSDKIKALHGALHIPLASPLKPKEETRAKESVHSAPAPEKSERQESVALPTVTSDSLETTESRPSRAAKTLPARLHREHPLEHPSAMRPKIIQKRQPPTRRKYQSLGAPQQSPANPIISEES